MQFFLASFLPHLPPSFPQIHDYGRSLSSSSSYYVELWDVGGSPNHRQGRAVFYQQVNGIILVHDLTNRKSHANLTKWLSEFYRSQARDQQPSDHLSLSLSLSLPPFLSLFILVMDGLIYSTLPGRKASRTLPSFDSHRLCCFSLCLFVVT